MTSVARPPRRPSTLAIRSLWPTQVPTRDTESWPSTGVAMRVAKIAEYKRAFMSSLPASILQECIVDVSKTLPIVPVIPAICNRRTRDGPFAGSVVRFDWMMRSRPAPVAGDEEIFYIEDHGPRGEYRQASRRRRYARCDRGARPGRTAAHVP